MLLIACLITTVQHKKQNITQLPPPRPCKLSLSLLIVAGLADHAPGARNRRSSVSLLLEPNFPDLFSPQWPGSFLLCKLCFARSFESLLKACNVFARRKLQFAVELLYSSFEGNRAKKLEDGGTITRITLSYLD